MKFAASNSTKKTIAMRIGSAKNNETKPLGLQTYQEPMKSLGVNLSYSQCRNNDRAWWDSIFH